MESPRKKPQKLILTETQQRWVNAFNLALGGATNFTVDLVTEDENQISQNSSEPELSGELGNRFGVDQARNDLLADGDWDNIPVLLRGKFRENVVAPVSEFMKTADLLLQKKQQIMQSDIQKVRQGLVEFRDKLGNGEKAKPIVAAVQRRIDALDRLVTITGMTEQDQFLQLQKLKPGQQAKMLSENPKLLEAVITAAPSNLVSILALLPSDGPSRQTAAEQFIAYNSDMPEYIDEQIQNLVKGESDKQDPSSFLRGNNFTITLLKAYSLSGGGKKFCDGHIQAGFKIIEQSERREPPPEDVAKTYNEKEDLGLVHAVVEVVSSVLESLLSCDPGSMPKPILICSSLIVDGVIAAGEKSLPKIARLVGGHVLLRFVTPQLASAGGVKELEQNGLTPDQGKVAVRAASVLMLMSNGAVPPGVEYQQFAKYLPVLQKTYLEMAQFGRKLRGKEPLDLSNFSTSETEEETEVDFSEFGGIDNSGSSKDRIGSGIIKDVPTEEEGKNDKLEIQEPTTRARSNRSGGIERPIRPRQPAQGVERDVKFFDDEEEDSEDVEETDPLGMMGSKPKRKPRDDFN